MGAALQLRSTPGEGSTFSVVLAASPTGGSTDVEPAQPAAGTPPEAATVPRCVLYIEDNEVNQRVASLILGGLGYDIRVVVNGLEESLTRVLAQGCWSEVRSFGAAVSDFVAEGEPSQFKVLQAGQAVAEVHWGIGGVHNQLNALASIAAAEHVGVSPTVAAQALATFENVKRRMEVRGTVNGITVYDDFAHHPTAIRTTVNGLRRQVGQARILAIFEPRSNTMKLGTMKSQLPWSLEEADLAFCHSGGLGWDAAEALAPMGARAQVGANIEEVIAQVLAEARPGDHLLCMSNGGFGGIHAKLLAALKS